MSFVIDSSVALSWCFPDEATPITRGFYQLATQAELIVPPLWHIEMANVLGVHLRRGRITASALDDVLSGFSILNIRVHNLTDTVDIASYVFQMRIHQLTAYDATYLLLAQQLRVPIATFDKEIIDAAHRAGVLVMQLPE